MNDFRNNLKYPITVEGIEVTDNQVLAEDRPKIVITRSLDSNLLSECLYNTYLWNILIITLLWAFQIMSLMIGTKVLNLATVLKLFINAMSA